MTESDLLEKWMQAYDGLHRSAGYLDGAHGTTIQVSIGDMTVLAALREQTQRHLTRVTHEIEQTQDD